jgi:hypothetical protein
MDHTIAINYKEISAFFFHFIYRLKWFAETFLFNYSRASNILLVVIIMLLKNIYSPAIFISTDLMFVHLFRKDIQIYKLLYGDLWRAIYITEYSIIFLFFLGIHIALNADLTIISVIFYLITIAFFYVIDFLKKNKKGNFRLKITIKYLTNIFFIELISIMRLKGSVILILYFLFFLSSFLFSFWWIIFLFILFLLYQLVPIYLRNENPILFTLRGEKWITIALKSFSFQIIYLIMPIIPFLIIHIIFFGLKPQIILYSISAFLLSIFLIIILKYRYYNSYTITLKAITYIIITLIYFFLILKYLQ